ncbi:MAG TPA: hypothetical protein VGC77_20755 [Rhodopseudomonas sp.]|uniref:hypothetical protein n=1 Tax=Rhodopseudomonas sp. TaxID=1078 RepID=UPI002ED78EB1
MDLEQQRNVVAWGEQRSGVETNNGESNGDVPPPLPADAEEQAAPGQWLGTASSTLNAIERLNATIDEETERLAIRVSVDLEASSQRKNRGLLELTRAMRLAQGAPIDPRVVPHLARLRASLVRNQAALQIHLDAVREVSAIIARSIQEVESDGTYSAGSRRCK